MAVLLLGRGLLLEVIGYLLFFSASMEQEIYFDYVIHLDRLMQDCRMTIADVLEILQSWAKQSLNNYRWPSCVDVLLIVS